METLEDRTLPSVSPLDQLLQLPLSFEPNVGQTDGQVQFLSRGQGYGLFLTPGEAVLNLYKSPDDPGTILQAKLLGANLAAPASGLNMLEGRTNYYIGNDSSQWRSEVPLYGRVQYQDVYPGINLIYYGTNQRQLEYDFVVAPGTDPGIIRVNYQGADSVSLDEQDNLILHTAAGDVMQHAPVIYQEINGSRQNVNGSFVLYPHGDSQEVEVGFQVGAYDHSRPLTIDPVLVYSTYLGGSGLDDVLDVAVDYIGNANNYDLYVMGVTRSANFPLRSPSDNSLGGSSDVFVARLGNAGNLIFSTYLGGSGTECAFTGIGGQGAIAADYSYGIYLTGSTQSANFPTTAGALQTTLKGTQDAFVVNMSYGGAVRYSTYLGGAGDEAATGIDTDGSTAYVTGWTSSTDYPTTAGALRTASQGGQDAFVAHLNYGLSSLVYSTYLGGSGDDMALDIALDSSNSYAVITGRTQSSNFPTTLGMDKTLGGPADAFVAKLNGAGNSLVFSTYLGGSGDENWDPAHGAPVGGVAVDGLNSVYVTGSTSSTNFPMAGPFDNTLGGGWDAFVTKLNASGFLTYSTFVGGAGNDIGMGIALNAAGNAFVTGYTESADLPTSYPIQAALAGSRDAFVLAFDPLGIAPIFSTYLGGSGGTEGDIGRTITVDVRNQVYVAGSTDSITFPTLSPLQGTFGGGGDGFISRLATIPGIYRYGSPSVNERGPTSDTYSLVLNAPPTANVTIAISPDTQVTLSATTLIFTPASWNTPQTVTVTAVDDSLPESTLPNWHTGTISHIATSSDPAYNGFAVGNTSASIYDNDTVAITWWTGGWNPQSETGPTGDTYRVVLNSPPSDNVTVTLDPGTQVTVVPTSLIFTPANWFTSQLVTFTVVDDPIVESTPHTGTIVHAASSSDTNYNKISITNATISITDNDKPGVKISTNSVWVTENGPTDAYTVVLMSPPTADVVITLNPNSQVSVNPATLTFTAANWNTPQTVIVTAVDDTVVESNFPTYHTGLITHSAASSDTNYNNFTIVDKSVLIYDNDTVGVYFNRTSGNVSETGPTSTTYNLRLTSTPSANVTISLNVGTNVTVAPGVLIFTPANWFNPQTVNVTAFDDGIAEGPHSEAITHTLSSSDTSYDGLLISNFTANIADNDFVGVYIIESTGSTDVSETGPTSDKYTIRLGSQPLDNVTIALNPDNQITTLPTSLVFTPSTWNITQLVTVTAVNDWVDEPALHTGKINHGATSGDPAYNNFTLASITVHITDNDTAGITTIQSDGTTNVDETGPTADSYTLQLNSQPVADVTISLSTGTQVTLSPAYLVFTAANWNTPQAVTVTAVDDKVPEGTHYSPIAHTVQSSDPNYAGFNLANIVVTIADNDVTSGVKLTESNGNTTVTEGGNGDDYTVELKTQPTADVTVILIPDSQVTVSTATLIFTSTNWNVPQPVSLLAVDDFVYEKTHHGIIGHTTSSADPFYQMLPSVNLTATIIDNDAVGVVESGGSTDVVEKGATDSYSLALSSQPTANVTLTVRPDSQVTVSPATLIFTPSNWNVPQTVTVTAVDDYISQGTRTGLISHTAASRDTYYNGIVLTVVRANIFDNDTPGIAINPTTGSNDVTEGGGTDTYSVRLTSQPFSAVVIYVVPDSQVTGLPGNLVFTAANWNVPQNVTVRAVDDLFIEGNHKGTIVHTAVSSDPGYSDLTVPTPVQITDNDIPGATITPTGGSTSVIEDRSSDSFTVTLNTPPSADVTITLNPGPALNLSAGTLIFTTTDWNRPQTVSVTAPGDTAFTGTRGDAIAFATTSPDADYNGVAIADVTVTIIDDEGYWLTGTPGNDIVIVAPSLDPANVLVLFNGKTTFVPLAAQQLILDLGFGNDTIQINDPRLPVFVRGDQGNDTLKVNGQNAANTFVLDNITLDVNGNTLTLGNVENLTVTGGSQADSFNLQSNPDPSLKALGYNGGLGIDVLNGADLANTWKITATNTGLLNGSFQFSNVENLTGGTSADTFVFNAGKNITGRIDGGGGNDALDYSLYSTPLIFNLQAGTATGTGGIQNIETILAGKSTSDKLIGPDGTSAWNLTGKNAGAVNGTFFQNIENLTGGSGDDTFTFADAASLTGKLDGGPGTGDTLDYSAYSTAVSVNLQAKKATAITLGFANIEGSTGGSAVNTLTAANKTNTWTISAANAGTIFDGTTTYTFAAFANLTGGAAADTFTGTGSWTGKLDGGLGLDTLAGDDTDHAWNITAPNAGTFDGYPFANIENLKGGSGSDTFTLSAGKSVTGKIDGGAGSDILDYSPFTTAISINLQTGKATAAAGILNLEQFLAGSNLNNFLYAPNLSNAWNLTATNAGTFTNTNGTYNFTGFQNLTGGTLDDAFTLALDDAWTGYLQGGLGIDSLTAFGTGNFWTASTLNGRKFGSIENTQ